MNSGYDIYTKAPEYLREDLEHIEKKYFHIFLTLGLLWSYDEFGLYISRILTDTRDGTRKGFAYEDASVLLSILEVHDEMFPKKVKEIDWKYP